MGGLIYLGAYIYVSMAGFNISTRAAVEALAALVRPSGGNPCILPLMAHCRACISGRAAVEALAALVRPSGGNRPGAWRRLRRRRIPCLHTRRPLAARVWSLVRIAADGLFAARVLPLMAFLPLVYCR